MIRKHSVIILICLVFVVSLAGCSTKSAFQAPLAPTMGLSTPTILPETLGETTSSPEAEATATATAAASTSTPSENKTCGQSGAMTLLLIGSDVLGSSKPNGADAIRIMKINFDTQKINVITFPRDMLIQTASVNNASMVQQKLGLTFNEAFTAASGTALEKNAVGARVLAQLILSNFGVQPENYITLQMNEFGAMIDAIGGVEINNPTAITTEHNISFPAGVQTLNGSLSTEYLRALNPGGETARTARQNLFINALQTKMISIEVLPKIPSLITEFKDAIITDLSIEQLADISCLAALMPKENISFGAITAPDLMTNNVPNIEKIKAYLNRELGN